MNADQLDRFAIRERIKNWVAWREAQDWPPIEPELRPPPSRISMANALPSVSGISRSISTVSNACHPAGGGLFRA